MKKEHYKYICEQFNIDSYSPINSAWIHHYEKIPMSTLMIDEGDGAFGDASQFSIIGGSPNYNVIFTNLPLSVAKEILTTFKETEVMFI